MLAAIALIVLVLLGVLVAVVRLMQQMSQPAVAGPNTSFKMPRLAGPIAAALFLGFCTYMAVVAVNPGTAGSDAPEVATAATGDAEGTQTTAPSTASVGVLAANITSPAGSADEFADVKMLSTDADLLAGQKIFVQKCAACHGQQGEGMVGPNLTDDYWIHGGEMANVMHILEYGVPSKGMTAWGKQLSDEEMQQVASYVLTLKETSPENQKAPQGTVFRPASREWIYTSNEDAGELNIVSAGDHKVLATIPVGQRPRGVRVSPDGSKVYVALSGSPKCPPSMSDEECESQKSDKSKDGIAEIDVKTRKVLRVLPGGSDPEQFDISPDGTRLFVANEDAAQATIVDIKSGKIVKTIEVGREPEGVKISPDGKTFYVTSESDHSIHVLDAETGEEQKVIEVGKRPRDIIFSHDGSRAYVSNENEASVSVIDVAAHKVIGTVTLPQDARPMGLALSRDNQKLYVANGRLGSISEIDLTKGKTTRTVEVGKRPWGLALSSDGRRLYTANGPSHDVTVVDAGTFKVVQTVATSNSPWGVVVGPSAESLGDAPVAAPVQPSSLDIEGILAGGSIKKGATLFNATLGCAHCHGTNSKGGHDDNRNLRELVKRYEGDSEKIFNQVMKEGRMGTAMPPWDHLTVKQKADIKAFVFSLQEKES